MTSNEYKMLLILSESSNKDINTLVYINKDLTKTERRFGLADRMISCAGKKEPYCLTSLGSRGECYVTIDIDEPFTFDFEDIQLCKEKKVEPPKTVLFNYDLNSTKKIFNE